MENFKTGYFLIVWYILMPFTFFNKVNKWPMMKSSIITPVKYYYHSFFLLMTVNIDQLFFFLSKVAIKIISAAQGIFLIFPVPFIYKCRISNFMQCFIKWPTCFSFDNKGNFLNQAFKLGEPLCENTMRKWNLQIYGSEWNDLNAFYFLKYFQILRRRQIFPKE